MSRTEASSYIFRVSQGIIQNKGSTINMMHKKKKTKGMQEPPEIQTRKYYESDKTSRQKIIVIFQYIFKRIP